MARIFLSHSHDDNFEASAVRDWLVSEGWDDVFLDLDPERGIVAGERWERALHQAAMRCEAVIFLVSKSWLDSGWCRKEYQLARSLNKQLFGVLIDSNLTLANIPPEYKGTWQAVDFGGGTDGQVFRTTLPGSHKESHVTFGRDGLRRLKRGLEKAGLDPMYFPWPPPQEPNRSPYRGLKPLETTDAGIFFGRDAPIVEAIDRLRGISDGEPPRILVIIGASGAGKSSFLRAGLLPRLKRDDRHFVVLPPIRPERAALSGENGLLGALYTASPGRGRAGVRQAISQGAAGVRPLLLEILRKAVGESLGSEDLRKPPAVVIAVDQGEELFRGEGSDEAHALLVLLRDLTSADGPTVIVVFAIRSDSYDALEHAKPLEGLPQATLPLLPLPRGAYKEVIEGPAARVTEGGNRLEVEPRLTQSLLDDIEQGGGSDALPLIAFTLEQLWLEFGSAGSLRLIDYQAFGGLRHDRRGGEARVRSRGHRFPYPARSFVA